MRRCLSGLGRSGRPGAWAALRGAVVGGALLAGGCGDDELPGPVAPLPGGQPASGAIQAEAVPGGVVGHEAGGGRGRGAVRGPPGGGRPPGARGPGGR